MLKRIIEASVRNKFLVLVLGLFIAAGGIVAMRSIPVPLGIRRGLRVPGNVFRKPNPPLRSA